MTKQSDSCFHAPHISLSHRKRARERNRDRVGRDRGGGRKIHLSGSCPSLFGNDGWVDG